jgi:hypothetical protein
MDVVIDIARSVFGHRWDMWLVILSALVLAWFELRARARRLQGFHAWWLPKESRAATRSPRRAADQAANSPKPAARRRS